MDEEEYDEEWVDSKNPLGSSLSDDIDAVPRAAVDLLVDIHADGDADSDLLNDTIRQKSHRNDPRAEQFYIPRETEFWGPSQVSLPKGSIWGSPGSNSFDPAAPNDQRYTYNYDIADASDTYVYVIHDEGVWTSHQVSLTSIPPPPVSLYTFPTFIQNLY